MPFWISGMFCSPLRTACHDCVGCQQVECLDLLCCKCDYNVVLLCLLQPTYTARVTCHTIQNMRRQARADSVPTVAYSDSLGEGGGGGTVPYYLASAFDQIYVHETGLVSFTGAPCTCTCRMHPHCHSGFCSRLQ